MRTKFGDKTELLRAIHHSVEVGILVIGPTFVAEELGISKSTAHKMLNELSFEGFGLYVPKKGLILNEKGMREAERAVRIHRLIECLLEELGVKDFCSEAERLENNAGKSFVEALERRYAGRKFCPCGKKIPGW